MNLHRVFQKLESAELGDIRESIFSSLNALGLAVPQGEVAITAGSRGIANIAEITKSVGAWLRAQGASPFIVPAMGSHNGATAEGQRAMIESLGITEAAMEMEIRASMDVVEIGRVASGTVYMDKHCYEAAAVFVLNRIKLHTCFSGPVQSGLMKMMVVGMGKIKTAQTFHSAPNDQMKDMIQEMGQVVLDSGKILAGLAILEDGFDKTAELHAVLPQDIPSVEPKLLERHRKYFPALPIDSLEVLIVSEIGKTFSGTGMDTNVIGYRGIKGYEDLDTPSIRIIAALDLAEASKGNAIGVGLADFITTRLRDAIDERKTFLNVYTTGDMNRGKIPFALESDEELVRVIKERFGEKRWMFIPNTLQLEHLYVSEDLVSEIRENPACELEETAIPLCFENGKLALSFR
ncbi:MAG: DUF2088 domain-containing protein [Bdellovibrionales bacterium]|nr:DUF2088 domain-containing protein [Bdellovibrionales bacterium]